MEIEPTRYDLARVAGNYRKAIEGPSQKLAPYYDDPVAFAVDILGLKMWPGMESMLTAIAQHDRILIRAGHKVSKSCTCAVAAFWWVGTREGARVLATAPTFRQVKTIIWREMRLLYTNPRQPRLRRILKVDIPRDPHTGIELPGGQLIEGLSADKPENLAGVSAPNLLIFIDEGSGFDDELMEVILGNAAGDAKIVSPTNPTKTSGWHFEAMKDPDSGWEKLHIPSTSSPNVVTGEKVIPGLATRRWVEEMQRQCGGTKPNAKGVPTCETHPMYRIRVMGSYPDQATNAVVGYQNLEDSKDRWRERGEPKYGSGEVVFGIDVARFGDDESVIALTIGNYTYRPRAFHGLTGPELAQRLLAWADEVAVTLPIIVNVDGTGVGASVVDALNEIDRGPGMTVNEVIVSEVAPDGNHANLRSQLWFAVAAYIAEEGCIPPDTRLEAELLAPTYSFDVRARKKVEPKDKIKERLGRSPDRADAVCLSIWRDAVLDQWDRALENLKG